MKYFYTDPLAAAWMAKHFRMKFLSDTTKDETPDDASDYEADTAYEADCGWGKAKERKYYIHPESLHLLEPKDDDMDDNGRDLTINEYGIFSSYKGWAHGRFDGKIIQRNGIAFMWPECEI